jgi:hypothetical protein
MSVKLTARSAVNQANINQAKNIVLDKGATKAQLETPRRRRRSRRTAVRSRANTRR